jgi:hypothetical protein
MNTMNSGHQYQPMYHENMFGAYCLTADLISRLLLIDLDNDRPGKPSHGPQQQGCMPAPDVVLPEAVVPHCNAVPNYFLVAGQFTEPTTKIHTSGGVRVICGFHFFSM